MNKRAVEASSFLVGAIITIVSFLVLAPIVINFSTTDDCKKAEEICQWSVNLRATTTTIQIDNQDIHTSPLLCKTCDQDIKEDKEKVKKQIADSMAQCWWMFGEGRYEEILKKDLASEAVEEGATKTVLPEFSKKNDCFLCYSLFIKNTDGFEKGDQISFNDFYKYLLNNPYDKAGKKYIEYFQSHGGPGRVVIQADIKPNHAYGISFGAKNKKVSWETILKKGGRAFGNLAVAAGGVIMLKSGIFAGPGLYLAGSGAAGATQQSLSAAADIYKNLYTERDTSTIYLSDLKTAQKNCFSGDIAGK